MKLKKQFLISQNFEASLPNRNTFKYTKQEKCNRDRSKIELAPQYLVCPPFALVTALILLVIEFMRTSRLRLHCTERKVSGRISNAVGRNLTWVEITIGCN